MVKNVTNTAVRAVAIVLSITALVWLWWKAPQMIVAGFDMNLAIIKKAAAVAPAPYGAMGEAALRGLGADRALIFAEGAFLVRFLIRLTVRMISRRKRVGAG